MAGLFQNKQRYIRKSWIWKGWSPVSLWSDSSINNSRSSVFPPLTIESPSSAATFNIIKRPITSGTLLIGIPRNLSHPGTASPNNEAVYNMLEAIKYNNIRGHMLMKYEK